MQQWCNLNDEKNGMSDVLMILFVEWIVFMALTLYFKDLVVAAGGGINKHPLSFLNFKRKDKSAAASINSGRELSGSNKSLGSTNFASDKKLADSKPDVAREVNILFSMFSSLHVDFTLFNSREKACADLLSVLKSVNFVMLYQ